MEKTSSLVILGSTGSIGTQSIDVALKHGYSVKALTAANNIEKLEEQIRLVHPETVAVLNEERARDLKVRIADTQTKVYSSMDGICQLAYESDADTAINAIVGMAGIRPTLATLKSKKKLALANKETLVAGGELVLNCAKENNIKILPVDSEHSAIFQCLQGQPPLRRLKKIILTASGGPFFGRTKEELENVTIAQALNHPNWSMGAKITIDSATMFNKGLELIEAVRLFDVTPEQIDIVVHRESIVHSAVEYDDNAVIAQLGVPDMRIPIQYALTYPDRTPSPSKELDLTEIGHLSFYKPDTKTFRCIEICKNAIKQGGLMPCAVNAANEEINKSFREGKIKFNDIPDLIEQASAVCKNKENFTLDDIFQTEMQAREQAKLLISKFACRK